MVLLAPRPFLLGGAFVPLQLPIHNFLAVVPVGTNWRLMFLLVDYGRTIAAGAQTSPDLSYRLYDADGRAYHVDPALLPQVTSPAGAFGVDATSPLCLDYPGGTVVRVEITGQVAGPVPATISITLYGIRGWESYGA